LKKAVPSAPAATQTVDNEHLLHGVFSTAASFTPMVDEQQPLAHEFFSQTFEASKNPCNPDHTLSLPHTAPHHSVERIA